MGTKKISELQELETLNDNDLIPIVDSENEATKKVTIENFKKIMKINVLTVTGIPDSNGFLSTTIPKNNNYILSIRRNSVDGFFIPYSNEQVWTVQCLTWDKRPITTQLTIDILYIVI